LTGSSFFVSGQIFLGFFRFFELFVVIIDIAVLIFHKTCGRVMGCSKNERASFSPPEALVHTATIYEDRLLLQRSFFFFTHLTSHDASKFLSSPRRKKTGHAASPAFFELFSSFFLM